AFLEGRTGLEPRRHVLRQPQAQLFPKPLVGPRLDLLVRAALQVIPAARPRAHAAERESALMLDVHDLARRRLRIDQQAEPAERIGLLVQAQRSRRDRPPADAVKAVAAGDEVAGEPTRVP